MKRTLLTLLYTVIIIAVIVGVVRFGVCEFYRITPGQMGKTLLTGDRLWVNKWDFKWGKLEPKRGDILLYTLPETAQHQSNRNPIAIARCIGLPGDTICGNGSHLYINGREIAQSSLLVEAYLSPSWLCSRVNHILQQNNIEIIEQNKIGENRLLFLSRYDYNKIKKQLPPTQLYPVFLQRDDYEIVLPRKHIVTPITPQNAPLLHRLLTQYEHRDITLQDGNLYENGVKLNTCRLQQNYYWVIDDKRTGLSDSRSIGPLPYSQFIGRGMFVGFSIAPNKPILQSIRTDRFFKTQL